MPPKKPAPRSDELFRSQLDNMIDMEHALVKLAGLIDWSRFDEAYGRFYHEKGRPGLSTRLMAGLHLLKHMEGLSDEAVCARWVENPYYQYFCGEQYFRHKLPLDRSSMTRWRGGSGLTSLNCCWPRRCAWRWSTRAVTPQACERVTVDTTVQTKAVAHPTDSHLLMRGIEWLNRLARKHGLKLRQSFLRLGRQARRDVSRLIHGRGHKQAMRWVRKLRTWLGRLDRDIGRKIAGNEELEAAFAVARERVAKILTQKAGQHRQALRAACARGGMHRQGQGEHQIRVRRQDFDRGHQCAHRRRPVHRWHAGVCPVIPTMATPSLGRSSRSSA
jgi:IS5 family transposase